MLLLTSPQHPRSLTFHIAKPISSKQVLAPKSPLKIVFRERDIGGGTRAGHRSCGKRNSTSQAPSGHAAERVLFRGKSVATFVRHFGLFEENEDFNRRRKRLVFNELTYIWWFSVFVWQGLTW
jgi:hypothetical protein